MCLLLIFAWARFCYLCCLFVRVCVFVVLSCFLFCVAVWFAFRFLFATVFGYGCVCLCDLIVGVVFYLFWFHSVLTMCVCCLLYCLVCCVLLLLFCFVLCVLLLFLLIDYCC